MSPNGEGDNYTRSRSNSWVSSTPLLIASTSTWPRKPRNWTTFQVPGNRLKLLAWAHLPLERRPNQDRPYFVDKFPLFLSRAPRRGASCGQFCYIDGEVRKPSGFDTYLLQVQRFVRSAGLVPGGIRHGGPVYVSEGGEHFLALVWGPAEDRTACPSIRNPATAGSCFMIAIC